MSGIPLVQRPLILIGAGRSGSTLLTNILNNQPQISFHGETGFLAPRLWDEVWVDQFWYQWRDSALKKRNQKAKSFFQVAANRDKAPPNAEKNSLRAGRLLAELFFDLVGAQKLDHWGFKEPWLGHPNFDYSWEGYDALFPHAIWLHLTRNPFDFARSAAQWNREAFDESYLRRRLFEWALMTKKCREKHETGRYYDVRFEDLIGNPEKSLSELFDRLDIEWNPDNDAILKTKYIASSDKNFELSDTLGAAEIAAIANDADGFRAELDNCDYGLPESVQFSRPVLSADESARSDSYRVLVARSPRAFLQSRIDELENEIDRLRVGHAVARRFRAVFEKGPKLPRYVLDLLWKGIGTRRWLLTEEPRALSAFQRMQRQLLELCLAAPDRYYRRVFAQFQSALKTKSNAAPTAGRMHFMIGSLQPGGAERQAMLTLAGLARRGFDRIGLSCMWMHDERHRFFLPRLQEENVPVDVIGDHSADELAPALRAALAGLPASLEDATQFAAALASISPAVAHLWLDEVNIKGGLAAVASGVPKVILSSRNLPPNNFLLHKAYMREAYRWLVRQPGVELVNNSKAGALAYEEWLGLPRGSVAVIQNGFEFDRKKIQTYRAARGAYRKKLGVPKGVPLIGGVFRLQEEKRPLLFLEIAAKIRQRMPEVQILLVGGGPMGAEMEMRSRRSDLKGAVHFAGYEKDVYRALADLDLLLLCSRGEGLPNVLIEAQAMGVPVVTTPAGGAPEAIDHGRTGIVLKNANSEEAAEAIAGLLRDEVWLANAHKAGPEFVERNFSMETAIDKTLALYGMADDPDRRAGRDGGTVKARGGSGS